MNKGKQSKEKSYAHTCCHCSFVIMNAMASQILTLTIVYFTIDSCADQTKHQSSAVLSFVRGIHRWPHRWRHHERDSCERNKCAEMICPFASHQGGIQQTVPFIQTLDITFITHFSVDFCNGNGVTHIGSMWYIHSKFSNLGSSTGKSEWLPELHWVVSMRNITFKTQ